MKHFAFTLKMPNRGSWDGKWSGDNQQYVRTRRFRKSEQPPDEGNYHYSWNDGWGASVTVQEVTALEAAKLRKTSKGFCGYDWMIRSICRHGKIKTDNVI